MLRQEGDLVVYGMFGKCRVLSVESRSIGGETQDFYKLEPVRHWIGKPTRKEPAIWVPVKSAESQGLRSPLAEEALDAMNAILSSREYYFTLGEAWHVIYPQLDAAIRTEGATGLAKVVSYLFVLRKRVTVPSSDMNKFWENTLRLLLREICDLTQETSKQAEERIIKLMKPKLQPDT